MKRLIATLTFFTLMAISAQAHMLWLNVSNYYPEVGDTVWVEIGWGHKYPRDQVIGEGLLEQVYAIGPRGEKIFLEKIFPSFYRFVPKLRGAYLIVAKLKPGFVSITTEGHKLGNKKQLKNVVSCFKYIMGAKALIEVGEKSNAFSHMTGEPLEIIPLKDPANLKSGDILPLKILFEGKPLSKVNLQAIYTGYRTDKKHHWAIEEKSDPDGVVRIKLNAKGQWMFKVGHKTSYPDISEADQYMYTTTFTLGFLASPNLAASNSKKGKIYLVGVGPGDPDLLTIRALNAIRKADLIVCWEGIRKRFAKELEGKKIIEPPKGVWIWFGYGKKASDFKGKELKKFLRSEKARAQIIAQVYRAVKDGKTVAFLGHGDPLIYGPWVWILKEFKEMKPIIIPGLSSFNAANAALKKGVTSGKDTKSVILTMPDLPGLAKTDTIERLASHRATLVIFMPFVRGTKLADLVQNLSAHYPINTPIALVLHAGYKKKQKVIEGTLSDILSKVGNQKLPFESLVYVGDFLNR